MEYDLIDITKNYNGHIILKDAIQYNLPIPIHWGYTKDGRIRGSAGNIIEIRWEGSLLIGVTDEFNEDHDLYSLWIEFLPIQRRLENDTYVIEQGVIRSVQVWPIAAVSKEQHENRT